MRNLGIFIMGKACMQSRWVSCESKLCINHAFRSRSLSKKRDVHQVKRRQTWKTSWSLLSRTCRSWVLNILSRFSSHQDGFSAWTRISLSRYLHRKTWNFHDNPLQITWRRSTRNCRPNTLNISLQTNKKRTLRSTIGWQSFTSA
jgi:hypothetical protein